MLNKIVLAGGSGYIGQVLCDYYKDKAKEIIVLSRSKHTNRNNIYFEVWDAKTPGQWSEDLEGCDLLINLCGKNVNCRYTKRNQDEILQSRLQPTSLLNKVIAELKDPPKVWIQLASSTIYRHAVDRFQDEDSGEIGTGFSVDVCKAWEKTFWQPGNSSIKKILLRVALVMGRNDGVVPRLTNLVKFGLGGKQGNGDQYVSWIHELDLARITEWVYYNGNDRDIYNCASPEAIKNKDIMKLFRKTIGVPVGLPAPQWLLEIGAVIIGTETELVLKSRWVYPSHLLEKGYRFLHEKPDHALREILCSRV